MKIEIPKGKCIVYIPDERDRVIKIVKSSYAEAYHCGYSWNYDGLYKLLYSIPINDLEHYHKTYDSHYYDYDSIIVEIEKIDEIIKIMRINAELGYDLLIKLKNEYNKRKL